MGSCTLNSEQEASLNKAMSRYIESRNDEQLLSYVAYTYPSAVAYYKNQGDSVFVKRFTLVDSNGMVPYIQDGNIKTIKSSGDHIHVKYRFLSITEELFDIQSEEIFIYAISKDDGKTWYFLDEIDYKNDEIVDSENRLIYVEG